MNCRYTEIIINTIEGNCHRVFSGRISFNFFKGTLSLNKAGQIAYPANSPVDVNPLRFSDKEKAFLDKTLDSFLSNTHNSLEISFHFKNGRLISDKIIIKEGFKIEKK